MRQNCIRFVVCCVRAAVVDIFLLFSCSAVLKLVFVLETIAENQVFYLSDIIFDFNLIIVV